MDIIEMGRRLIELRKIGFTAVKDDIDKIINSGKKDKETLDLIEHNLDYLISFCCSEEEKDYFNSVCDYVGLINKDSAQFYRDELKNYFEEEDLNKEKKLKK